MLRRDKCILILYEEVSIIGHVLPYCSPIQLTDCKRHVLSFEALHLGIREGDTVQEQILLAR
jgi:hypothetical protein